MSPSLDTVAEVAAGGARRKFGKTYSRTYTNREREDVTKEKEDSLFPSMFSQELCQDETPTKAVPRQRRGESSRRRFRSIFLPRPR